MHVFLFNDAYETGFAAPADLLARYHSLTGWAQALAAAGCRVSVWQRFHRDAVETAGGVRYSFVADRWPARLRAWQVPLRLHRLAAAEARQAQEAVAHVNGLAFGMKLAHLRRALPQPCPIAAQHHAEKPARGWRRWLQRWGLRRADGFLFTAAAQAQPWLNAGQIGPQQPVFEVMEGSSAFCRRDRAAARASSGLRGDPLFLWIGRLDANKDPLTVLEGFARALPSLPAARLAMIYHTQELLPAIQSRLAQDARLQAAVALIGRVPHAAIEDCLNSADFFVLGSHYEGSGYALVEALACGVTPVVTDIPSFRWMTAQGSIGRLWPVGDAAALADALRAAAGQPGDRAAIRQYFDDRLSYPAIAQQAMAAYRTLLEQRARRAA